MGTKFRNLTLRSFLLAAILLLLIGSIAYAMSQFTRDVSATINIQLKTQDGIEVYLDSGLTQPANAVDFATVELDVFGTVSSSTPIPVWVQNNSLSRIELSLDDDFDMGDVSFVGGGKPILDPGDVLPTELVLTFDSGAQGNFGFNVLVRADGPIPPSSPKPFVFSHTGVGEQRTPSFNVNSSPWNIVYQADWNGGFDVDAVRTNGGSTGVIRRNDVVSGQRYEDLVYNFIGEMYFIVTDAPADGQWTLRVIENP